MTEDDKRLLDKFETSLRHLIYLHDELKKENEALRNQLAGKQTELEQLTDELKNLRLSYSHLKTASTIGRATGNDVQETKKRLSGMVREIDKCIALLNC